MGATNSPPAAKPLGQTDTKARNDTTNPNPHNEDKKRRYQLLFQQVYPSSEHKI